MAKSKKVALYHRPDWHPKLMELLGDIIGEKGYVTQFGTISLIGPLYENPNYSKYKSQSDNYGPTMLLTAKSSLGFA